MVLTVSEFTFLSVDQIDASSCGLLARWRLGNGRSLLNATDETIELQLIVVAPYVSSAKLEEDVVADLDAAIDSGSFLSTLLQYGAAYNLTLFDDAVVDPGPEPSAAPTSVQTMTPTGTCYSSCGTCESLIEGDGACLSTCSDDVYADIVEQCCSGALISFGVPSVVPTAVPIPAPSILPTAAPSISFVNSTIFLAIGGMAGCDNCEFQLSFLPPVDGSLVACDRR